MKRTVGILAHVDAGKTTFSQRVLFHSQSIRSLGRVDHQDSYLDSHPLERRRGITIFSGQACITFGENDTLYWLDTPGHVDFSAEMERSLSVIDTAILVISAVEGIQSHSETVWRLLQSYQRPVFVFINKCDREGADADGLINKLKARLSSDIVDFRSLQNTGSMSDALIEEIASRDEKLLDRLFDTGFDHDLWMKSMQHQIAHRQCFPVMCGSALQGQGISEFINVFRMLNADDLYQNAQEAFSAQVYRIRHDLQGTRLCFMKILTGSVSVKNEINTPTGRVKVNELRIYHGEKYRTVNQAFAGDLIAIPGIDGLLPGDGIGTEERHAFHTEPMMAADLLWDTKQIPVWQMSSFVHQLQDEEPTLAVEEEGEKITVHIMGAIQLEVLRELFADRFSCDVSFGPCRVLYRETIAAPSIGIGHYEPLRHYAEVHLRLIPTEPGSGITFRSLAHVDDLALNWQRLIETHVFEKQHKGVLTGSPLTDVRIELLCGRDHLKHTEGGDFRQATYRAIRNALMYAQNVLLEPICGFEVTIPSEQYGTIVGGLNRISAELQPVQQYDGTSILRGQAPYALFMEWQQSFMMLTHGRGLQRVWMDHYAPCRNQELIVAGRGYEPLADDTPDSVFCSHGAGFTVAWDHVKEFAHLTYEGK